MHLLLIYDITSDRIRTKVATACEDFGLDRIQFSAFYGSGARPRQGEGTRGVIGAVTTRSGRVVRPLAPDDATVDLGDVAHHLSLVCRFGGACSRHYSVAQHCVLVSRVVPATHALAGLLHDAAEAYIGDVVSGLKRLPEYAFLRRPRGACSRRSAARR